MLTERDKERYSRQIAIPGFGEEGQEKLEKGKVAIAGAGGLGSAVAIYLAAAGVGYIRIIDDDTVELSNLNRQILHGDSDIGRDKVLSAVERLRDANPDVEVEGVRERITGENAVELLGGMDAVVDCLDNFDTRYVLNDASIALKMPLFHGACSEMGGQVATVIPGRTACLRCMFPDPPPPAKTPVLGAAAGTIGTIQSTEVVKFLTGTGDLLAGKLLIYDGMFGEYDIIEVKRNGKCPSCGGGGEAEDVEDREGVWEV